LADRAGLSAIWLAVGVDSLYLGNFSDGLGVDWEGLRFEKEKLIASPGSAYVDFQFGGQGFALHRSGNRSSDCSLWTRDNRKGMTAEDVLKHHGVEAFANGIVDRLGAWGWYFELLNIGDAIPLFVWRRRKAKFSYVRQVYSDARWADVHPFSQPTVNQPNRSAKIWPVMSQVLTEQVPAFSSAAQRRM
jgi:hypothetical protein